MCILLYQLFQLQIVLVFSNMTEDIDEECCNSGCNNCILDIRQRQQQKDSALNASKKLNLFDGTYKHFVVISIAECSNNVHRFRFKIKDDEIDNLEKYTIEIPPTYHLFIRVLSETVNESRHDKSTNIGYISRPYTPIEFNRNQFTFDILVKFETNGKMSNYLRSLTPNSVTEWKGCYGNFTWCPNPKEIKHLVCICQGVAIAPMYSLIKSILSNENDDTLIHLIACFKNLENCLLRDELAECRKYWNFQSTIFLSQPNNCGQFRYGEIVHNYRLTTEEIKKIYFDKGTNSIYTLVCGTNKLENLVKSCVNELIGENYFCFK